MQEKPSTEQCYLYYSCAVCTVLLIKYEIINLVHHLRPFTKNYNFQALWDKQGRKKTYVKFGQTRWFIVISNHQQIATAYQDLIRRYGLAKEHVFTELVFLRLNILPLLDHHRTEVCQAGGLCQSHFKVNNYRKHWNYYFY